MSLEWANPSPFERSFACWDGEETIGAVVRLRQEGDLGYPERVLRFSVSNVRFS
jgi:hypothetical protein